MAFDVEGARKAGYSDGDIADYLATKKEFNIAGARKAGYDNSDIITHLVGRPKKEPESRNVGAVLNILLLVLPTLPQVVLSLLLTFFRRVLIFLKLLMSLLNKAKNLKAI